MFPHDTEAVWRLTTKGAIYVVQDPDRAGSGLLTVALDDLDAYEKHLREAGIAFTEQAAGHAPRRLVVTDLDGNTLTFFEDPAQPAREAPLARDASMSVKSPAALRVRGVGRGSARGSA